MSSKFLLITLLMLPFGYLHAMNNADDDLSGFELDGFDTDEPISTISNEKQLPIKKESNFTLSGNIAVKGSFAYLPHRVKAFSANKEGIDYLGIDKMQTSLYLQADMKLSKGWKVRISGDTFYDSIYDTKGNRYNDDTLRAYRTQLRFDDTYIQGSISDSLDVKIGRQVVVWGKSDSIRITDIINPIDNRLPGVTDIEDLRLPTTMLKLDYYIGKWDFSAMLITESRIFLEAAPRGEFFPVEEVYPGAPEPFIILRQPSNSVDNLQYAFAANATFSSWDLSFYGADVLDSKWHFNLKNKSRDVSKIKMLGTAFNIAIGSWLLKSEMAYINGVRYNSTSDEKDRVDMLIGFDYMGIKDTVLSLEVANKHIFDYESQMILKISTPDYVNEDEIQTALRANRSFSNDSINTTALISLYGHNFEYGGFARVWAEIEIKDALNANIGIVDYITGNKPYVSSISNNDRVFADITYSF